MIILNKLDGTEFVLNSDFIETIEMNPDTVITLSGGKKIVVKQSKEEIIDRIVSFKKKLI
ncbi:MAG: flagellar FlbD family protein [Oscillospiraceae bacterium]|nr:flagellar FlbD family protein [Oscillospiraceae bacterium]